MFDLIDKVTNPRCWPRWLTSPRPRDRVILAVVAFTVGILTLPLLAWIGDVVHVVAPALVRFIHEVL